MPVITPCYERGNLIVNGSFEDLGTEDGGKLDRGDNNWGVLSQIPGWTSGAATDKTQAGLEIQADGAVPQIDAKDGEHYAELDSDALNQCDGKPSLDQRIHLPGCRDGRRQQLRPQLLLLAARRRSVDAMASKSGSTALKVATINSGKVGEWTDYTFVVEAGEGDGTPDLSKLEFKAVGTSNSLGGFIDDVSLTSCAIVDEDALPNGIEGGPGDDVGGACFSGSLGVNFGADGGKSIVFSDERPAEPDVARQSGEVCLGRCNQTLIGYTGANAGKNDPANWVFTVAVQSLDNGGEYKFTLLKPLDHPDSNNNPADDKTDNGTGSFEDNLVFDLKFKATDRDDDTVEGKLQDQRRRRQPEWRPGQDQGRPVRRRRPGPRRDQGRRRQRRCRRTAAAVQRPRPHRARLREHSVNVDLSGGGGNPNAAYGADGPGTTALSLTGPGGAPFSGAATNLFDTATGEPIFLYTEGGLVVGRVGSGGAADAGGDVSFALSIDNAGNLSVAQYRAIQHPDATNPDDSVTLLAAGGEDAIVHITAKITDYDGDAITVTVPLDGQECNGAIKFEDDGPSATCDYNSVTEGAGNIATGNVVTGANPENAVLGTDANGTDGNADNPGVDGTLHHQQADARRQYLRAQRRWPDAHAEWRRAGRRHIRRRQADHHDGRGRDLRNHHGQRHAVRGGRVQVHRRRCADPRRGCALWRGWLAELARSRTTPWPRCGGLRPRRNHLVAMAAALSIKTINVNPKEPRRVPRIIAASASTPASTVRKSTPRATNLTPRSRR